MSDWVIIWFNGKLLRKHVSKRFFLVFSNKVTQFGKRSSHGTRVNDCYLFNELEDFSIKNRFHNCKTSQRQKITSNEIQHRLWKLFTSQAYYSQSSAIEVEVSISGGNFQMTVIITLTVSLKCNSINSQQISSSTVNKMSRKRIGKTERRSQLILLISFPIKKM